MRACIPLVSTPCQFFSYKAKDNSEPDNIITAHVPKKRFKDLFSQGRQHVQPTKASVPQPPQSLQGLQTPTGVRRQIIDKCR